MAESKMVNFRATEGELNQIDKAAAQLGLSRSDFIKQALKNFLGGTPKPAVPAGPVCVTGVGFPKCQSAVWVKVQGGAKLCQTCGVTRT